MRLHSHTGGWLHRTHKRSLAPALFQRRTCIHTAQQRMNRMNASSSDGRCMMHLHLHCIDMRLTSPASYSTHFSHPARPRDGDDYSSAVPRPGLIEQRSGGLPARLSRARVGTLHHLSPRLRRLRPGPCVRAFDQLNPSLTSLVHDRPPLIHGNLKITRSPPRRRPRRSRVGRCGASQAAWPMR